MSIPEHYKKLADSRLSNLHIAAQWLVVACLQLVLRWKFNYRILGEEHKIPGMHSYIVASNHISNWDPPIMTTAVFYQPIAFMAKIELFDPGRPWYERAFYYWMNAFAVTREKVEVSSVKSALKVLKSGRWCLGLFPEGTRGKDGNADKGTKRGVAYFSKAGKCGVLPLGIARGRHNPKNMTACLGPMIEADPDQDAMTQKIDTAIRELTEKAQADADSR